MNAVGSIQKWLTFWLSADQGDRFRQANFRADIAQARICIFLISLTLVAIAVTDYYLFGLSWSFYEILVVRLALIAYSIWLLKSLPGLTNYQPYDRTEVCQGVSVPRCLLSQQRPHVLLPSSPISLSWFSLFYSQFLLSQTDSPTSLLYPWCTSSGKRWFSHIVCRRLCLPTTGQCNLN